MSLVNMWRCWMPFVLAWVSMATPTLCQSSDGDWGSGFDIYSTMITSNGTFQAASDDPERMRDHHDWVALTASSPILQNNQQPDPCSVHFSTSKTLSRRLKAQKEELAYLKAIQHGNKAVIENLLQFVEAELGDQNYEDVIKENVLGIQDDQKSCQEAVEKAEEDLEEKLEGDAIGALAQITRFREETLAFEDMLRTGSDIASRLESLSKALHASFTKQQRDIGKIPH